MVVRVAEQAAKSGARQIWIATDHQSIIAAVHEHGFKACLTHAGHASGTDRIAEVVEQLDWPVDTIVVNVQGDEPLIPPGLIHDVAQHLHDHPECSMATACHPIHDAKTMCNPHVVKAVLDKHGNALYFSRAPIPWPRDAFAQTLPTHASGESGARGAKPAGGEGGELPAGLTVLRHIGIYAYRAGFLRTFRTLAPAAIEQAEALEQLRVLWHGYKIGVAVTAETPPGGVDTEEDLRVARQSFASAQG